MTERLQADLTPLLTRLLLAWVFEHKEIRVNSCELAAKEVVPELAAWIEARFVPAPTLDFEASA